MALAAPTPLPFSLRLLGDATLTSAGRSFRPERKMAGLLTYLALSGATSRQRLAGLLWPDVDEARARNSLAQLLLRLRRATYAGVVRGGTVLALDDGLEVDVAALEVLAFEGETARVLAFTGELLHNFEFDDCDEFADWLHGSREAIRRLFATALTERIGVLTAARELGEALGLADRLIALDPLSEPPYRTLMRLHAAAGDRAAALRAFAACRQVLASELGVEPDEETRALAEALARQGSTRAGPAALPPPARVSGQAVRVPAPARALPQRVGREAEWARLERAWADGLPVYLSGPPGIGKSRLAHDFATSRGVVAAIAARPGDAAVPLLTLARGYRRLLSEFPGIRLEPWVANEVARLVPELAERPPTPMTGAEDRLRFDEAVLRLHQEALSHAAAFVYDDLQFGDPVSWETWARTAARLADEGQAASTIFCFRSGEMPAEFTARLAELEQRGEAAHIALQPLCETELGELAGSVSGSPLGLSPSFTSDLHRYTGGNPLFAIEVVSYLTQARRLGARLPDGMPPPGRVGAVVRQRLARLSSRAARAAQAAAVLQSDFDVELVAGLLETDPLELMDAWDELERSGIVQDGRFGHDVVHEVVLADTSQPVRALLHRRAAAALTHSGAPAARVAQHWLEGGRQREALPELLRAGAEAQAGFRLLEARGFYGRAAAIAELLGDAAATFTALARELELVLRDDTGRRPTVLLERLEGAAHTAEQRATAAMLAATHFNTRGKPHEAESRAREGLAEVALEGLPQLRVRLLDALATSQSEQNRFQEALASLGESSTLLRDGGHERELADTLLATGAVLNRAGRDAEALARQREARAVFVALADRQMTAVTDMHVGVSHEALADYPAAEAAYLAADALLREIPGTARFRYNNDINLGYLYWGLERYADALHFLEYAESHEPATAHSRAIVARVKALVFRALGDTSAFEREITEALRRPDRTDPWRSHARMVWADELAWRGRLGEARDLFDELARSLGDAAPPLLRANLHLTRASHFGPVERLEQIARAERLCHEFQLPLQSHVELRRAQALLAAGDPAPALQRVELALALDASQPLFGPRAELHFTRHQALAALANPEAGRAISQAQRHVERVAGTQVPGTYAASFLTHNRLNAAIGAAAAKRTATAIGTGAIAGADTGTAS